MHRHKPKSTIITTHWVIIIRVGVLLRTHPQQPIIIEEDAERVTGGDQHIDAHVTFVAVNQEGFVQILLYNSVIILGNLFSITIQLDTERMGQNPCLNPLNLMWLVIGWQLWCQSIRSQVWKFLLTNIDFHRELSQWSTPQVKYHILW